MAKIALSTEKYVIHATLTASGVVEKPDIVGAIFGQTEGLLGDELELRELQKSGRVGRIEVNVETKMGKTAGKIEIPSSLSKQETALIAAAVKTIDRIGPCEATVEINSVEDVRASKREFIMTEAQNILNSMMSESDSLEISEQVKTGARAMGIVTYGPDKLDAGPEAESSDEIVLVEGRADVINLLRAGIKNAVSVNGTSGPRSITDLTKQKKSVVVFLDGDRGGDLILKALEQIAHIDYICRAPSGKEVEELAQKEILQCLRGKVAFSSRPTQRRTYSTRTSSTRASPTRASPTTTRSSPSPRRESSSDSRGRGSSTDSRRRSSDSRSRSSSSDSRGRSPYPSRSGDSRPRSGGYDRRSRGGDRRDSRGGYRDRESTPYQKINVDGAEDYAKILDAIDGSNTAKLLDKKRKEIAEVPTRELRKVLTDLGKTEIFAIVMDGAVSQEIVDVANSKKVSVIVGKRRNFNKRPVSMVIATRRDLSS